jgi:hypothetical protein
MTTAKKTAKKESNTPPKRSLFDHIKHIRSVQSPDYFNRLSEEDQKSFNHFMIIRALAMDDDLIETVAPLYQIFDKVPSPQFYTLLIALIPKNNRFCPWIKSKKFKHNKGLLELVGKRFQVPKYQAADYVNSLLLNGEAGQTELVRICKAYGLEDKEIEALFEDKKDE